jgi:uncharacterized membrane protein
MKKKSLPARWRANFLTGLFLVLPAVISLALIKWVFGTISSVTDTLLFFLPKYITHETPDYDAIFWYLHTTKPELAAVPNLGEGPLLWYWSVVSLVLAGLLISLLGRLARNYFGRKVIHWTNDVMLSIPLFNKVYATIKQVNEAFSSGGKDSFKTVVRVEWPRAGMYALGFLTSEQQHPAVFKTPEKMVCVFIPTTPNPTSGFMLLVPEDQVTRLDMTVADGIKYIVSLGSISPEYVLPPPPHA